MRNTHIDLHDALDRALVAIGNDYPAGHLLDAHAHRRAQLLYGATGVMLVLSEDGGWVVPPQRRLDPGRRHAPGADAGVSTRSAYIEPGAARADRGPAKWWRCRRCCASCCWRPWTCRRSTTGKGATARWPGCCCTRWTARRRCRCTSRCRATLGALCQAFMAAPDIRSRPQDWAGRLHMSPRSFSRHFREHTGMSYAQWRQRACVVLALARLAAGDPVTVIALDFGYQGPAAFSTMFRRVLGAAPSAYLRTDWDPP